MLHCERSGQGEPVVLIHGFTQSGRSWRPVVDRLADRHQVLTVDAPGHGRSGDVRADLWASAELIAQVGDRACYVGYSMGGRLALHVALAHPELVTRLVVVSANGGLDDPAERAARRASDEVLAQRVERDGVEAFVTWWLGLPLFATLTSDAASIASRLESTPGGLASSLRSCGTGSQDALWDRLGSLTMPVLVIAGELDPRYVRYAERLVTSIGANAELKVIAGAGHACHLERPDVFVGVLEPFLSAHYNAIPRA